MDNELKYFGPHVNATVDKDIKRAAKLSFHDQDKRFQHMNEQMAINRASQNQRRIALKSDDPNFFNPISPAVVNKNVKILNFYDSPVNLLWSNLLRQGSARNAKNIQALATNFFASASLFFIASAYDLGPEYLTAQALLSAADLFLQIMGFTEGFISKESRDIISNQKAKGSA